MKNRTKTALLSMMIGASAMLASPSFAEDKAPARIGHLSASNTLLPQIETPEQAVLFSNAQNLVGRWNNIITFSTNGDDQLRVMRESGVFADDIALTFVFPDNTALAYTGLDDEPKKFYNDFVNGLKKGRNNIASNVEAIEFYEDGMKFRFRHAIFMGSTFSLAGHNEIVMKKIDGRYVLTEAVLRVVHMDTQHAY